MHLGESSSVFKILNFLQIRSKTQYVTVRDEKKVCCVQASGSSPVNKVIVEGLFTEQSGTVHRAKCQRVSEMEEPDDVD